MKKTTLSLFKYLRLMIEDREDELISNRFKR